MVNLLCFREERISESRVFDLEKITILNDTVLDKD